MKKILNEWNRFLTEVDYKTQYHLDELEQARIAVAVAIDRAIMSPKINDEDKKKMSSDSEESRPKDPAKWKHLVKMADIVKKGRKVPFLYYAYRGVDEKGKLLQGKNTRAVLDLTAQKVHDFLQHFDNNEIGKDVFISDFHLIKDRYQEYQQAMADYGKEQGVEASDFVTRSDVGKYSIGPDMNFSVSAIGSGSKPVSFVNQDFMYKDGPEYHNISEKHNYLFSPYFPLALAVILLSNDIISDSPEQIIDVLRSNEQFKFKRAYAFAMQISIEHAKKVNMPSLTFSEMNANYINVITTSMYSKNIEDAQMLNEPEAAILQGSDFSTFLKKFRILVSNSKTGFTQKSIENKYADLAAMITPTVQSEILYVSTVYPKGGLPQIKPNEPTPPEPTQFPDSAGNTLTAIVERAEDFHFLYPRIQSLLFGMLRTSAQTIMKNAYDSLQSKGLKQETNPNSSDYEYGPPMKVIRGDWYETVYTEEEYKQLGLDQAGGIARPRDVQQRDRRTSAAIKEKLSIIDELLKSDNPDVKKFVDLNSFIAKLKSNMEQEKITFLAFPEDVTLEDMVVSMDIIRKKISGGKQTMDTLREHFRRFV